jgi:peptidoglycan/LPS O-acetylase OafA/YrhL
MRSPIIHHPATARLDCLDGLRGALAVYVLLSHMAPFAVIPGCAARVLSHGGAAVDVFFILSGLVITRSLESYQGRARPFLIARAARIFPLFLVLFSLAVAVQLLPASFDRMGWIPSGGSARSIWSSGWPANWAVEIAAHLTMTHGLFPNGALPDVWVSFLGAAWSLSAEWQFYLLALSLARLGLGMRGMVAVLLGLGALGLLWDIAAPDTLRFSRAFLPNKAAYFALGVASAALVTPGAGTPRLYGGVLAVTLGLCAARGGLDKLLPPLAWTLCLAAQTRPDVRGLAVLARLLRARVMTWLGAVSYGLYLANEPIQRLLGAGLAWAAAGNGTLFTVFWLPGAIVLPLAAAAWLHRVLELPAQRWGRARAMRFMATPRSTEQ